MAGRPPPPPRFSSLRIQYWTSRGIAVLDVDYGGSTGYGRAYRERLKGDWGIVDVEDCVNAARHVIVGRHGRRRARRHHRRQRRRLHRARGLDPRRRVFKGGASYYGVSDVAALARDTHKFESRYLDWLIGPYPEREDLYRERSPLTHADALQLPGHLLPGRRRPRRAAEPDRDDGRRVARPRHPGRLSAVRRRAARLPPRRERSSARSTPSCISTPRWSSARVSNSEHAHAARLAVAPEVDAPLRRSTRSRLHSPPPATNRYRNTKQ